MGRITKTTEQFLAEVNNKWIDEFEICLESDISDFKIYNGVKKQLSLRHKPCGTIVTKLAGTFLISRCAYCLSNDPETKAKAKLAQKTAIAKNNLLKSTEDFITEVNNKWNNEFEYSGVEYLGSKVPMSLKHIPCGNIITKSTPRGFLLYRCDYCRKNDSETISRMVNKIIETSQKKYNTNFPIQSPAIRDKSRKTSMERYGYNNPLGNPEVRQQIKKNRLKQLPIIESKFRESNTIESALIDVTKELHHKPSIIEILHYSGYSNPSRLYSNGLAKYNTMYKKVSGASMAENEISDFIERNSDYQIIRNNRSLFPNKKEIDIYIPELNIGIEYCGLYWHSSNPRAAKGNPKDKNYHLDKLKIAEDIGIRLIQIFESEWILKQEIVKAKLTSILRLNINREKIYARKCQIKPLSSFEAREFCESNHIQGYINASIREGLIYNNKIVAIITFIKLKNGYELSRYCTRLDCQIVGGASKLLNNTVKKYDLDNVYTFSDNRWSSRIDNMYIKIGFKIDSYIKPNYFYWRRTAGRGFEIYHRTNFQKHKLEKKLGKFDSNLTEFENMELFSDFNRIYDAGNIKYRLKLNKKNPHSN